MSAFLFLFLELNLISRHVLLFFVTPGFYAGVKIKTSVSVRRLVFSGLVSKCLRLERGLLQRLLLLKDLFLAKLFSFVAYLFFFVKLGYDIAATCFAYELFARFISHLA